MPRSDAPKYIEKMLDSRTTAQYTETQWLALLTYEGPQLNFNPESVLKLRAYLNLETPPKRCVISELHTAENNEGWLTIITANRAYDLSELATSRLKEFLNEVVQEGNIDAH